MTDVAAGPADQTSGGPGTDRADESRAAELRAEMVAGLVERGALSAPWRHAVEEVARHMFLPDTIWEHDDSLADRDYVPLRRGADPDRWLAVAYADAFVATQVDDGQVDAEGRGENVTSSASMPTVVAEMLTALQVDPGMRVLEIGTGTGWNAALLAHRLGPQNVVSMEIDAALAEAARARLERAGYGAVTVLTAGDVDTATAHGPFDRLIATVAASQVPPGWIAQVRPGGIALIPWGTDWYPSALLRLTVDDRGRARGRIVGDASFMLLRDQRVRRVSLPAGRYERGDVAASTTELHPWYVKIDPNAATAIGLRLPGIVSFYRDDGPTTGRLIVIERDGQSWALLHLSDTAPYEVEQGGPRRLWDEVEAAYREWQELGAPERSRWTITVGPEGQRVELNPGGRH